jgi:hypothetical protein
MVNLETIARTPAQVKARNHTVDKLITLPVSHEHVLPLVVVHTRVDLKQEMLMVLIEGEWHDDSPRTGDSVIIIHAVDRNGWFVPELV